MLPKRALVQSMLVQIARFNRERFYNESACTDSALPKTALLQRALPKTALPQRERFYKESASLPKRALPKK
jgi:hypothetical protein